MSHRSLIDRKLSIKIGNIKEFEEYSDVVFIELPFSLSKNKYLNQTEYINNALKKLKTLKNKNATVCILCSPLTAMEIFSCLEEHLYFKQFIAVKLCTPIAREGYIPAAWGALLVFTAYKTPLRHTKTRISYTYCPHCGKTTKDYGGKKHLFDSYGTIISDVWRDISWDIMTQPSNIVERVRDLFSIDIYKSMVYYPLDLNKKCSNTEQNIFSINIQHRPHDGFCSKLIHDDVLNALRTLQNDSIDFCFADPPYNLKKKYNDWNDNIDSINYFNWCDAWLSELCRVLKPGGVLAIINIPQWSARHYQFLRNKLSLFDIIAWEGLSMPVRMIMPANYTILCFSKGSLSSRLSLTSADKHNEDEFLKTIKEFYCSRSSCIKNRKIKGDEKEPISNIWWDVHRLKHNSVRVNHPCQLPPKLMYRLISLFSRQGDIVLDAFNGSGTTTLTAQQLNRNFIGIELSEDYHKIATHRHSEINQGLDPFRKRVDSPNKKAKNSYVKRMPQIKHVVSKKTLQLEVKKLAIKLARIPTEADLKQYSSYPIEYFHQYFINWSEVIAATRTTGMSETPSQDSNEQ